MLHRILIDALMQDADLIDPEHDAADLGDRRPGQSIDSMKRLHPTLNFQRSDIASELIAPAGNEVVPNVMLDDRDSVDRLLAHCIVAKIGLQIEFREGFEADASTRFFTVDTNEQP
jgi:hypothetical protein